MSDINADSLMVTLFTYSCTEAEGEALALCLLAPAGNLPCSKQSPGQIAEEQIEIMMNSEACELVQVIRRNYSQIFAFLGPECRTLGQANVTVTPHSDLPPGSLSIKGD